MRVEIELISPGLNGKDGSTGGLCFQLALDVILESFPGAAGQLSQKTAVPSKGRSENFGDGPDHLAVVDRLQDCSSDPFDKPCHPLGLAGGTEITSLTGKGQQIFVTTGGAANPGKAIVIDPAVEKTFDRFFDHLSKGTELFFVEVGISFLEFRPVAFQTLEEGAVFGMPLPVSTWKSHALPTTFETGRNANLRETPQ